MITYRPNRTGTLQAAYLGTVRVGYVEERASGQWIWQTIFVRPEGGGYNGKEDDETTAKACLERAVRHWMDCARLRSES